MPPDSCDGFRVFVQTHRHTCEYTQLVVKPKNSECFEYYAFYEVIIASKKFIIKLKYKTFIIDCTAYPNLKYALTPNSKFFFKRQTPV